MKNSILYKTFFYLSIFTLVMSCSKDDDLNLNVNNTDQLIGIWELNEMEVDDSGCEKILKLTFNPDFTGSRVNRVECSTGEITSSISLLEWSTNNNLITLSVGNNETINDAPYSFNANEQLILKAISNLPFNKVD